MKTLILFVLLVTGIASANVLPLKDGDSAMIESNEQPGLFQEVHVLYIENGMARVRAEKTTANDFFDQFWLATVPVDSLVHPVDSLGEFTVGDKVCLNKSKNSFSKGFCSKVHRMYENGSVELWNGLFTSNVIVEIRDIKHRN